MTDKKITDDEVKALIDEGVSNYEAGRRLGVHESTFRYRKKKIIDRGYSPKHDWNKEVPEGHHIKGVSTYYDKDGKVRGQWVKSNKDKEQQLEALREACNIFCDELPKIHQVPVKDTSFAKDTLAVYPLGDPHVGMLAWDQETGQSWDLKIAESAFLSTFDMAVKTAPSCEQALIVNLGDYFHYDNLAGVTSRSGNRLDIDGRYAKMVQVGVRIMRQMIQSALEHHKKVRVITAIGNHDDVSAMWLSIFLKNVYQDEPRVEIDDLPAPFHYYIFGKVMLGVHHGHTCKMDKLPMVMANDRPEDWGKTKHRYWLTGHIHHDSVKDSGGAKVESFRTLAAPDLYAHSGGYRSGQDTKVIVYHKDKGEILRHTIGLPSISS